MTPFAFAVRPEPDHLLVRLSGPLSLDAVLTLRHVLAKALADRGRVVVDVAAMRLDRATALEAFPAALQAAGGWPGVRMVLVGPSPGLARALRAARIERTVPLVEPDGVRAGLDTRPPRVGRHAELACDVHAPGLARAFVRQTCADWAVDERTEDAVVVVNELVTNAVLHARTSCRVLVGLDDRGLHLAVRDGAPAHTARPGPVDLRAERGRGLHLVVLLSSAWGVTEHRDGKTVWAVLGLAQA